MEDVPCGKARKKAVAMHNHTEGELPSETEGLPEARRSQVIELSDGDEFNLEIAPIRKQIGDSIVRMLAYNGSVPGPTLKVPQNATITVHITNRGDIDATVHWHGRARTNTTARTRRRRRSRSARPSPTR